MLSTLHLQKLAHVASTEKQRKHFRYKVREVIKQLPEEVFLPLMQECLHSNHYPLLEEYVKVGVHLHELTFNRINILPDNGCLRQEITNLKYLFKSHRKTLTTVLTTLTPDGYTAEVLEWLVIYNYWGQHE